MPTVTDPIPLCTVCGLAPAVYASVLLGTDDVLCRACAAWWYEQWVTDRHEMQSRRFEDLWED